MPKIRKKRRVDKRKAVKKLDRFSREKPVAPKEPFDWQKMVEESKAAESAAIEECKDWNATNAADVDVVLALDNGERILTRMRSPAQVSYCAAVAWVEGFPYCFPLRDVTPYTKGNFHDKDLRKKRTQVRKSRKKVSDEPRDLDN